MAQHKKDYLPEDIMFPNQNIITSELVEEMQTSYIDYAMSVIVGRALPDVRDGLKPCCVAHGQAQGKAAGA